MKKLKLFLILFAIGAIIGSFFDAFHTHSGTTFYTKVWLLKMAWWVPLLFGSSAVLIGFTHLDFDLRLRNSPLRLSWFEVIAGFLAFGALYFASAFINPIADGFTLFHLSHSNKIVFLGLGAFLIWLAFERSWIGFMLGIATTVVGCTVESTLTGLNQFHYVKPDFLRIPYWLPFLYFAASVAVGNVARKLNQALS